MSETEKKIPPVTPKGWRHVDPPTYARPKVGQGYLSDRAFPSFCESVGEVVQRADNGRRWIIEQEPAIGGHDDAKAHEWARPRRMRVVGYRPVNKGDRYIGWSFLNSSQEWNDIADYERHGAITTTSVYIVAPLADAVVEPVQEVAKAEPVKRTAPDGETWVTMRLRDVNRLEHERDSMKETVKEVASALKCPEGVAIDLHALEVANELKTADKVIEMHEDRIESLIDEIEKARHEASNNESQRQQAEAWLSVSKHCTKLGADWGNLGSGTEVIIDFITELHGKAKTAEEARQEGAAAQAMETVRNMREACDMLEAQVNQHTAQKLREAA